MKRRDEWRPQTTKQWQVQPIDMNVDHVKVAGLPSYRFEQRCLRRDRVRARSAEPKSVGPGGDKFRARDRITACEKRHVVAQLHKLLDEPRDDTFGAAVKLGWNAFRQRGNLCN